MTPQAKRDIVSEWFYYLADFAAASAYWQERGYNINYDGTADKRGKFLSARDVLEQWRNRDEVVSF